MSSLQTSQSLTKRKKGLSLSLEKKQKNKGENQQSTSLLNQALKRQSCLTTSSSARKNKIKFAQSYQKHESGSKFKKQKYLKITDQDIKLGGSKKINQNQHKIRALPCSNPFSQFNSRIQSNNTFHSQAVTSFPWTSERKVLRESKVVALTSNINYFQGINLSKQNSFCYPQVTSLNRQPICSLRTNQLQPLRALETLPQNKLQQSEVECKASRKAEEKQKSDITKQSMDTFTLQKLKKVQIDIDQLLAKASQTRTMLLR